MPSSASAESFSCEMMSELRLSHSIDIVKMIASMIVDRPIWRALSTHARMRPRFV
jgi:hypothetical protein